MNIPNTHQTDNIYVPGLSKTDTRDRQADTHNQYTDREVARLPLLDHSHPHYPDWTRRATSCRRLIRYLAMHKQAASILEIGCGNGWLSHQLSRVPGSRVIGLDPNLDELRQAARVFRHQPNLKFIYGDFYSDILQDLSFDIIVIAATIRHFPSLRELITDILPYLRTNGEFHLLDPCFSKPASGDFKHRYLYNPRSFWNRMLGKGADTPWVCITKRP